jgi:multimeric flavodoxin WrbA
VKQKEENNMKVVAINGSPKKEGNTHHAIQLVAAELQKEGIEVQKLHVGNKLIQGCIACGMCGKNKNEQCALTGDVVNEYLQILKTADGIILGTPVHYAAIGGTMKSFLDRLFYVSGMNGGMFRQKVGASVVAVRRSGGVPTFNQLNNYLHYAEMVIPNSNYWNVIHGAAPGEVQQDLEGVQIMRILGKNMAWLLKLVENGKGTVVAPEVEAKVRMSFIR